MDTETLGPPSRPVALLITWVVLLGLFAAIAPTAQAALNIPFELLSLVMLAPALACVIGLLRPTWMPRAWEHVSRSQTLASAGLAGVAVLSFVGALTVILGHWPSWPPDTAGAGLAGYLALQAAGVLAEEIGWRGFVQRCGEQLAKPVVVSVIAGFIFGATHLGYWSLGLLPVLTFAITAMVMSVTITSIFVGSFWQRMVPAVVVHLGVNLGLGSLASEDQPLATTPTALGAAVIMLAITLIAKSLTQSRAVGTGVVRSSDESRPKLG
ncbi:CAAX prenyl protease-like protein [Glaciihabitans tibetensis]|uniref:CAAX prenyl protease-like protein n=1 Tax=Glaciihabitans tibetensis TaxID=1266600 RepID=A0A2T0VGN1_9MICO|nr:CPBP family intramembrane glutamic endopeptidase [Glaciihabitans tibetensis]PRY69360.1 CAAX prenyl protease-like protein [Glaciihabitans tibetensis]